MPQKELPKSQVSSWGLVNDFYFFFKTSLASTTSINAVIRLCVQNDCLSVQQPVTKGTALLKAPSHIPSGNCPKERAEGPFQHTPHTALPTPWASLTQHSWSSPFTLTNTEISFSSHTLGHLLVPSSARQIFTFPNNSPAQKARLALVFLTIHFSGSRK